MLNIKRKTRQLTFYVKGIKIEIKANSITRQGNLMGYNVKVNDKRYFYNGIEIDKAIDYAYCKWIKEIIQ
jgi:hypothetical protein